jgi:predicted Zn-dependent protease
MATTTTTRINGKLLASLVFGVIAFGTALHLFHQYQMRKNAEKLELAYKHAEEVGRYDRTMMFLERYLTYMPENTDALAKYSLLQGEFAATDPERERAMLSMEHTLRRDSKQQKVRRKLAWMALELNRYLDARAHADKLLDETGKTDAEAWYIVGRHEESEGRYDKARAAYEKAEARAPKDTRIYHQLASLLRTKVNDPAAADKVMDAMVAADSRAFEVYFVRSLYRRQFKQPGDAQDARRAVELAPGTPLVLLLAANYAKDERDWTRARKLLDRALKEDPRDARLYRASADVETAAGRPETAERVLLRGREALPDDENLKWLLANRQIDLGKLKEAKRWIEELRNSGYTPELVKLLDAWYAMAQRKWREAAEGLESLRPLVVVNAELTRQVDLLLVRCYERQGKSDKLKFAYHRMIGADPNSDIAQIGYAQALESIGRYEDALAAYSAVAEPARTPAVKIAVARLRILRNLGRPARQQRWDDVAEALAAAATAAPDSPQIPVLYMEAQAAQDKFDDAQALIDKARQARPDQLELWMASAALLERRGAISAMPALLDAAGRALGDRVELRLARARYYSLRGGPDAARLLGPLARDVSRFAAAEQERLVLGLAQAHYRLGDHKGALELWRQWADARRDEINAQFVSFDLALKAGDEPALLKALDAIRGIEGEDSGLACYGEASHLIWKAGRDKTAKGRRDDLARASKLLTRAATQRPGWARIPLAEAKIAELGGNTGGALEQYLRAVDLGERDLDVVRRALELLFKARRYADAGRILATLQDVSAMSQDLQRYAAEISVQNQDYSHALTMAQRAVSADSKDYRDQVWLGQILAAVGRQAEAEPHLRRGVELAPAEPAPWIVLVYFLSSAGRKTDAEAVVRQAETKLNREAHALALAQCHEQVGHNDVALKLYRVARSAQPDDESTLRSLVGFLLRVGRLREAEPPLRKLIALQDKAADAAVWAQLLARVLSAEGDPDRAHKAMEMLGLIGDAPRVAGAEKTIDQLRAEAVVLVNQKDERRRKEGMDLLDELIAREQSPADRFLKAQVQERQGDWPAARETMLTALRSGGAAPSTLADYVKFLLRHYDDLKAEEAKAAQVGRRAAVDPLDEATPWLSDLERQAPGAFETVQLQAWVLKAQGKDDRAVALLEAFGDRDAGQLPAVAMELERMGRVAETERALRQYVDQSSGADPSASLKLAGFLGRSGQLAAALDLCEALRRGGSSVQEVARAAADIVAVGRADAAALDRVSGWLESDLAKAPEDSVLLDALASVRHLQGRHSDAETAYRRALARDGEDAMALSNLAWLLAFERGKESEALELIERALDASGPRARPGLLDTRAVIELALDRTEAAIRDLEEATSVRPSASYQFHLARAYWQAKRGEDAAQALSRAEELGLKRSSLDPREHPAYDQLVSDMKLAKK